MDSMDLDSIPGSDAENGIAPKQQKACFMTLRHCGPVSCMTVMREPNRLVTGDLNNIIRVWDLTDFCCTAVLKGHKRGILDVSASGQHIYSTAADRSIKVWRFNKQKFDQICTTDPRKFSPAPLPRKRAGLDEKFDSPVLEETVADTSTDGDEVSRRCQGKGCCQVNLPGSSGRTHLYDCVGHLNDLPCNALTLTVTEKYLVEQGDFRQQDETPPPSISTQAGTQSANDEPSDAAGRPHVGQLRHMVLAGCQDTFIRCFNVSSELGSDVHEELQEMDGKDDAASSYLTRVTDKLEKADHEGFVYALIVDEEPALQLPPRLQKRRGSKKSPNKAVKKGDVNWRRGSKSGFEKNLGRRVFSGSGDGTVKVWRLPHMQLECTLSCGVEAIYALALVNGVLFTGGQDKLIRAWDVEAQRCLGVFEFHKQEVLALCEAPGMKRLASGSADHTCCIWDTHLYTPLLVLSGHCAPVQSIVAFDSFVVSASLDGIVKVWDLGMILYGTESSMQKRLCGSSQLSSAVVGAARGTAGGSAGVVVGSSSFLGPGRKAPLIPATPLSRTTSHALRNISTLTAGWMIEILRQLVALQTVSSDPARREDCWEGSWTMRSLLEWLGAETRFAQTSPGINPVVLGRLFHSEEPERRRTVLIYGHYDVQPAHKEDGWSTDPFSLTGIDGYLYGRGASDDKGPIVALIFAIKEALEYDGAKGKGEIPNFLFVLEGEGETGSQGLTDALKENKEWLGGNVDLIFVSNSSWLSEEVPCLIYGLRGSLVCSIEVSGPIRDLHTGVDGGDVREPLYDLVQVLGRIVDPISGRCLAPGFYDGVLPITEEEEDAYESIHFDVDTYKQQNGLSKLFSDYEDECFNFIRDLRKDSSKARTADLAKKLSAKQMSLMKRWRLPSLSVNCMNASLSDASVIPRRANARVSVRTVPNQDHTLLIKRLEDFLLEKFKEIHSPYALKFRVKKNIAWCLENTDNIFFEAAAKAIKTHWGMAPDFVREGGTVQATHALVQEMNAPVLHFPMGQSTDGAHLQNERIRLKNLYLGNRVALDFFLAIGKRCEE